MKLLYQGICWAADIAPTEPTTASHWRITSIPESRNRESAATTWYRCAFRLPESWANASASLRLGETACDAWVNGEPLKSNGGSGRMSIPPDIRHGDDANILVLKMTTGSTTALISAPSIVLKDGANEAVLPLAGSWQTRAGSSDAFKNIPLPAKFGTGCDIVFTLDEPLWVARPVTRSGEFTPGIEGPACDAAGNIFAVNFGEQGTIGRVSPDGSGEVFATLSEGSVGNGIRFSRDGNFFVADYPQHNILKVDSKTRKITKLAFNVEMNQPNDLAIAPDGTLYASDPNWKDGTGQLWRIDMDGTTTRLAKNMGTTNGIDVSPDGRTLYVNESKQRNVWAFDITSSKTLSNKRLIRQFPDHGFDGMRCDVDGNLYITRYGKGTVVKMTPAGEILQEINVLGMRPSNLCFGGKDGCTVYVTEVESTRLVSFRVDRPGRAWAERQ